MSRPYQYFTIPLHMVSRSQPVPTAIWYASWSTTPPPPLEPGMPPPLVVGATDAEPPEGAIMLGIGAKDPPQVPPLLGPSNLADYPASFQQWLQAGRDADE